MLTTKRRKVILELLEKEDTVSLQQLMSELDASESTIRRDLSQLEEEGLLIRVHGGAKRAYSMEAEPSVQEKVLRAQTEKERIGYYAASLVEEYDIIFLDAGTTTIQLIPYLADKNVTVVTNGVQQAALLSEYNIQTILLGGMVKLGTRAVIGQSTIAQLQQYRFKKAFLGMNGVDMRFGYTTPDEEEAAIKRMAMHQSSQAYVLADNSKLTKVSFCKVADIADAALITNATSEQLEVRFQSKTPVLVVDMDAQ